jgi:hypothetical protein
MKNTYIALGINPAGTALVLRPVRQGSSITPVAFMLCDIEAKGLTEGASVIGHILISALGAFHPEVDGYSLLPEPPKTRPFSTPLPLDWQRGEMRPERTGLGFRADATEPALLVRTYDCDEPIGEDYLHSLKQLAELGKSVSPAVIGEIMLRKLAAMHPDVLPPLFPTMAL